jgi:hypothetical protein
MRERVADHDVQRWAIDYLEALASAPQNPHPRSRANQEEQRRIERANRANRSASDTASERNPH